MTPYQRPIWIVDRNQAIEANKKKLAESKRDFGVVETDEFGHSVHYRIHCQEPSHTAPMENKGDGRFTCPTCQRSVTIEVW